MSLWCTRPCREGEKERGKEGEREREGEREKTPKHGVNKKNIYNSNVHINSR